MNKSAPLSAQRAAEGDKLDFNPDAVDPHISPQTFMRTAWVFELDRRDALLMLKALGGRLSDEEVVQARDLGNRLTIIRAAAARDALKHLQRAAEHAQVDIDLRNSNVNSKD